MLEIRGGDESLIEAEPPSRASSRAAEKSKEESTLALTCGVGGGQVTRNDADWIEEIYIKP